MDLEFIPQEYGGKGISDEKLFSSYTYAFIFVSALAKNFESNLEEVASS